MFPCTVVFLQDDRARARRDGVPRSFNPANLLMEHGLPRSRAALTQCVPSGKDASVAPIKRLVVTIVPVLPRKSGISRGSIHRAAASQHHAHKHG
jgi:hypothetical protein